MQIEDGMVKWKNFNQLILTKNYLELMENRMSSSGIFSQDVRHWKSSENPEGLAKTNIEPETFEDRIMFMPMFNDIDWTRRGNSKQCVSNSEQVKNYAKKSTQGLKHQQTGAKRRIRSTPSWKESAQGGGTSLRKAEARIPQNADLGEPRDPGGRRTSGGARGKESGRVLSKG